MSADWKKHDGGDCPCNRDAIVRLRFACGQESEREYRAGNFIWRRRGFPFDISEFRVVGLPEDARG